MVRPPAAANVTLQKALADGREMPERCLFALDQNGPEASGELSAQLRDALLAFAAGGNDLGCFLVQHLPIDELDGFRKSTSISETVLNAVACCFGTPFGYDGQREGAVIQNLWPVREHSAMQIGTGSCELHWHMDDGHAVLPPDYLGILCLRGDPSATTLVSRVDVGALGDGVSARLREPAFTIHADSSYGDQGADAAENVSIISDDGIRYDPIFTTCASPEHAAALAELGKHIDARAVGVTLARGDLLVIENRKAVHARSAFTPRYDDTDRWVQRTAIIAREVPEEMILTRSPLRLRSHRQKADHL
jgi:L-asparagine oxygenase